MVVTGGVVKGSVVVTGVQSSCFEHTLYVGRDGGSRATKLNMTSYMYS